MTEELEQIYDEIAELDKESDDLQMLEALASNAIYVLSKMQQKAELPLTPSQKNTIDLVLTDMLNTMNKELLWAKQDEDDPFARHQWFVKAKRQFLVDMKELFK